MRLQRLAQWLTVTVVAAQAAVAVWLAWRSLGWPLVHDGPIMHYIAWRLLDGAVPYRDVFDMNFPGVYVVHLAIVRVLGTGDAAWRAADLTVTAATAGAVAAFAAPWGRLAAFGGAAFFTAYHLASGAWNAGQRDFLLCPLLLCGGLGVVRWAEGRGVASLLAGGAALGAGLTIKPHTIVFVAGLAGFIALRAKGPTGMIAAARFIAGAAVPPLAAVLWLGFAGALGAWRDIVFGYLIPLYSRVTRASDWLYYDWYPWIAVSGALSITLAHAVRTRRAWRPRYMVALIGLAYGLVHFFGQRKGWEYHLYPLAAFTAVLVFSGVSPLLARRRRVPALLLLGSLAVLAGLLAGKGVDAAGSSWIALKERRVTALVRDLAGMAQPGDFVQVLDTTDGGVHALLRARLRTPTRFIYDFHFFHHADDPAIQRLRAELVRDLRARPPVAVVLWEAGWPAEGYDRIERFPALAEILAAYTLARQGEGYRIYAKRHDS